MDLDFNADKTISVAKFGKCSTGSYCRQRIFLTVFIYRWGTGEAILPKSRHQVFENWTI